MAIYAYGDFIPKIAPDAWIFPSADIIGNVIIGKGAYIGAGAVIRGDYGEIIIEDGVAIEENVTIHAPVNKQCVIHENAIIGHAAMLHGCEIFPEAVVGMSSVVSNDAILGERSILGEGAVITANTHIPKETVALGIPARSVKEAPKHLIRFWQQAGKIYRQLAIDYPQKLRRLDNPLNIK